MIGQDMTNSIKFAGQTYSLYEVRAMSLQEQEKLTEILAARIEICAKIDIVEQQLAENKIEQETYRRLKAALEKKAAEVEVSIKARDIKIQRLEAESRAHLEKAKLAEVASNQHKANAIEYQKMSEEARRLKQESDERLKALAQKGEVMKQNLDESARKCVIWILANAFMRHQDLIEKGEQSVPESHIDSLFWNRPKKCVNISVNEMETVILPYVKQHNLQKINLSVFKDEITEGALLTFFKALPDTKLTAVAIQKAVLENESVAKAKAEVEKTLAARGLRIVPKN